MADGWLVIESAGADVRHRLDGRDQSIGREADNDIVIRQPFVSRHHARLVWRNALPLLMDQQSTNGLLLHGKLASECSLAAGEAVEIRGAQASQVVRLRYEPETAASAAPSLGPSDALSGPPTSRLHLGNAAQRLTIGRVAGNDIVLDHPQVSRRHASIDLAGGRAVLHDQSINGTLVNGVPVQRRREITAGDRIRICCFELVFDGHQLIAYDQTRRARLDALHLSRAVASGAQILNDVTLSVLPREMIAVVGASGAGKSTLIDALNGVRPATGGTVLVNGRNYYQEFAALRLMVGYVPQSDVVHRDLPTERALNYVAELRLPADTTPQERSGRVNAVLAEVGLDDRRRVSVGQLSGGQIKRVSIGVELITRPSLFFLDEPTSGLDPGYEKHVMQLLRSLADEGRTVVLITHATQSIELCDHIAVMAPGGFLAYYGPPRAALPYFDCTDYPGMYTRLQESEGSALAARFQQHASYLPNVQARLPSGDAPDLTPTLAPDRPERAAAISAAAPLRQFVILVRRYAETLTRDHRNLWLLLLQAPIIAALAAVIAKPNSFVALPDAAESRNLLVILSCSMIWLGAMNAAREIVKELPIYRRERMVGLGLLPYLASKYCVLGILCLLQAAVLLIGVGLRARLPEQGLLFSGGFELYVTLVLAAAAGLAMGLLISTLFSNADRATALVPYLLIPQIMFVVTKLSGVSSVLAGLTISHWALQALGSSANLGQFGPALGGMDAGDYTHSVAYLLSRWLILLLLAGTFGAVGLYFLKRHDGELM